MKITRPVYTRSLEVVEGGSFTLGEQYIALLTNLANDYVKLGIKQQVQSSRTFIHYGVRGAEFAADVSVQLCLTLKNNEASLEFLASAYKDSTSYQEFKAYGDLALEGNTPGLSVEMLLTQYFQTRIHELFANLEVQSKLFAIASVEYLKARYVEGSPRV